MKVFGIDVGGSGIKGAPVDVRAGKLRVVFLHLNQSNPLLVPEGPEAEDVRSAVLKAAGGDF